MLAFFEPNNVRYTKVPENTMFELLKLLIGSQSFEKHIWVPSAIYKSPKLTKA